MPRPHYHHVQKQFGRKGQPVWYFRIGQGARTRLPGLYGSPEFVARYRELYAAKFTPAGAIAANAKKTVSRFTLAWLFDEYRKGPAWGALKATTRRQRDRLLYQLKTEAGEADVADIDQAAILSAIERRKTTPHQANHLLKTLRHVFDWAVAEGKVDRNPCERVKLLKTASDDNEEGHATWSEDELVQFEARWPLGSRERLVYAVLLYTGLRIGDAAKLGRQHRESDGTLKLKTEKTGTVVYLRVRKPLAEALAAGPRGREGELAFITSAHGRAFVKESLGNFFRDAVRAAGLTERSAHGLRKAAARRFAEAGATEAQLNALFGWTDPRMAAFYVREASKKRLALMAIDAADEGQSENILFPHTPECEGRNAKKSVFSVA